MKINGTEEDLEDAGRWDFERVEKRPGVKGARAVVSVAFAREDFDRVAESASQLGMKTSEFIREAALARADRQKGLATVSSYSGNLGLSIFTDRPMPTTRVSGTIVQIERMVRHPDAVTSS